MYDFTSSICIIIIILVLYYIFYNKTCEGFMLPYPIWNIPTRQPKLYYDIRNYWDNPYLDYRYFPYRYIFRHT